MPYAYDDENIFAKILRGEIPNDTVAETEHTLVFRDINPQAPVHLLVIPKGKYVAYDDFAANASAEEMVDFHRTLAQVSAEVSPASGGGGFRAIANAGDDAHQEVPHFHVHILGGRRLGPILAS
ncbi:MAG: HIT domain-containing protein [Pseudomonadota bacterium]